MLTQTEPTSLAAPTRKPADRAIKLHRAWDRVDKIARNLPYIGCGLKESIRRH